MMENSANVDPAEDELQEENLVTDFWPQHETKSMIYDL